MLFASVLENFIGVAAVVKKGLNINRKSVEERREMAALQTQNRNPNPNTREGNGKKREGQEKKKEEPLTPLSPFAKRDALSAQGSSSRAFDRLWLWSSPLIYRKNFICHCHCHGLPKLVEAHMPLNSLLFEIQKHCHSYFQLREYRKPLK